VYRDTVTLLPRSSQYCQILWIFLRKVGYLSCHLIHEWRDTFWLSQLSHFSTFEINRRIPQRYHRSDRLHAWEIYRSPRYKAWKYCDIFIRSCQIMRFRLVGTCVNIQKDLLWHIWLRSTLDSWEKVLWYFCWHLVYRSTYLWATHRSSSLLRRPKERRDGENRECTAAFI
jgi:hypothetical protein